MNRVSMMGLLKAKAEVEYLEGRPETSKKYTAILAELQHAEVLAATVERQRVDRAAGVRAKQALNATRSALKSTQQDLSNTSIRLSGIEASYKQLQEKYGASLNKSAYLEQKVFSLEDAQEKATAARDKYKLVRVEYMDEKQRRLNLALAFLNSRRAMEGLEVLAEDDL